MTPKELLALAAQARERAYCPYSHFSVGAALLCANGEVVIGCNIENAAYPLGNCAERTALFAALAAGKRAFSAIAVAGGPEGAPADSCCPPCGACRQVLREFCRPDFPIHLAGPHGTVQTCTLEQLLPLSFGPDHLEKGGD